MQLIEGTVSYQQHDAILESLHRAPDGRKLRVKIRRNSYDFQSTAAVQILTDLGWKELASLPFTEMASVTEAKFHYQLKTDEPNRRKMDDALGRDEARLLKLATQLLFT